MTDANLAPTLPWYQSRTIWATVATLILNIVTAAGYKVSPEWANSLPDVLLNIASLIGFGSTIWLHIQSKKRITTVPTDIKVP